MRGKWIHTSLYEIAEKKLLREKINHGNIRFLFLSSFIDI